MSSSSSPYVFNTFQKVLKQKGFQYTHSHFPGFNLSFHLVEIHEYRLSMWFWGPKLFEMKLLFHPGTSMSGELCKLPTYGRFRRFHEGFMNSEEANFAEHSNMLWQQPETKCSTRLFFHLQVVPTCSLSPLFHWNWPQLDVRNELWLSSLLNIKITYHSSSRTLLLIIAICYHSNSLESFPHTNRCGYFHSARLICQEAVLGGYWGHPPVRVRLEEKLWMILNDMQHYICGRVLQKKSGQHIVHRSSHYEIHIIALNHSTSSHPNRLCCVPPWIWGTIPRMFMCPTPPPGVSKRIYID